MTRQQMTREAREAVDKLSMGEYAYVPHRKPHVATVYRSTHYYRVVSDFGKFSYLTAEEAIDAIVDALLRHEHRQAGRAQNPSKETNTLVGAGSGALVGGLILGPIGAAAGAVVGGILGRSAR